MLSLKTRQILFWSSWFIILSMAPLTVFKNTSLQDALSDEIILTNLFQRLTGLLAYSLIFIQIILGSMMDKWVQIIGARAYKIHITQGLFAYGLMFIHPLFQNLIVYQASKSITSFFLVFVPTLASQKDVLLVFGRVAFILATISIIAAYFRTRPFFRQNWRAFHILNYLVFYLVAYHARVGTDLGTQPFDSFYWTAIILVTFTVIYRLIYPYLASRLAQRRIKDVRV